MEIDRATAAGRAVKQDTPPPRIQIAKPAVRDPSVFVSHPFFDHPQKLAFQGKEAKDFIINRGQSECRSGQLSDVQGYSITQALVQPFVQIRLGGLDHQPDVRVERSSSEGTAYIRALVIGRKQDSAARCEAGTLQNGVAPAISDCEAVQRFRHALGVPGLPFRLVQAVNRQTELL
jgi:hypothetical protein